MKNPIGEKHSRLLVLHLAEPKINSTGKIFRRVFCRCECGVIKEYDLSKLRSVHVKSCGCLNDEIRKSAKTTHGVCKEKLYAVWKTMVSRCTNVKVNCYKRYGGRGISVCDEWMDVIVFINWAKDNGYSDGLQIDRINNDGNYCPENCRWVTHLINSKNTSKNVIIVYDGKEMILKDWAKHLNVSYHSIHRYIRQKGGTINKFIKERTKDLNVNTTQIS